MWFWILALYLASWIVIGVEFKPFMQCLEANPLCKACIENASKTKEDCQSLCNACFPRLQRAGTISKVLGSIACVLCLYVVLKKVR